ncbi:MAG TPA: hypothetical protein VND21_05560 [Planctomycetota bacterium]|jgi:hypothetical protein|nr:hypothetical protein [Planctomycetota bacterium]
MQIHFGRPRARVFATCAVLALSLLSPRPPAAAEDVTEIPADLKKKIDAAIERGTKWLKAQAGSDGTFEPMAVNGKPSYVIGVTSLAGLALLAGDVPKNDPVFQAMLIALREKDGLEAGASRTTYNTGTLLMFLTEYYRPARKPKEEDPRYAKKQPKDPCALPKDAAAWVQELASWLVSVQLDDGWWRYPFAPPSDLSNTQYALLGLRAARDCGAIVPASTFQRALERALAKQEPDGPKMRRTIPASGKPGEQAYVVDAGDRARGWAYQDDLVTGSMTTAGIAALAIGRDMLMKPERWSGYTDELDRKVGRAVQDGFSWLDKHFAVDHNPPRGAPAWHYYYLYGLERACVFGGRTHVGDHDWYIEGAKYLVGSQRPEGLWSTGAIGARELSPSDICDTAWAILFLKRATRPTRPIPAPVITQGG